MRYLLLTFAAVSAFGTAVATTPPASAQEFPYCIVGKDAGYPGDCEYRSLPECNATVSGRFGYCAINPSYAYHQQAQPRKHRWR
jgi:hypothetical protein